MRICVVSEDRSLLKWCQEILHGPWQERAELTVVGPRGPIPDQAELFLWDAEGLGEGLPALSGSRAKAHHVFLLRREQLRLLEPVLPEQAFTVLVKPVDPARLRLILGSCLDGCAPRQGMAWLEKERDTILECLLDANLLLQEYDEQRSNFLARAVHDFRAPLTALTGYCGLLLSGRLGPLAARQTDVLQRMQHSVQRLGRTAMAMLELSGDRLADPKPVLREASLEECVRRALHEMLSVTEEKNLRVMVNLEPPTEVLRFEAAQIEQVLVHILESACKFTPQGGTIEIRGFPCVWERGVTVGEEFAAGAPSRRANAYRIEVTDTGPAVPEEWLERMFEACSRSQGAQDRSGGGLGLAICRWIVRAHQGEIFAFSRPRGFTLAFVLPYSRRRVLHGGANPEVSARHGGAVGRARRWLK